VINWPIVLSAFYAGLTLTCYLAARESRRRHFSAAAGRLLSGLSLTTAFVAIGLIVSAASPSTGVAPTASRQSPSSQATVTRSGHAQPAFVALPPSSVFSPPSAVLLPAASTPASINTVPRLQISSLNIDEPIQIIPIRDGQWDLTDLGAGIGRLTTTGARPGDEWAMVLVGHVHLAGTKRGPFAYLPRLKKNAEVIYQAGGTNYVYRVETISRAAPEDVNRLYLADGSRLLLVTCTDWDATQRIYTNRLIVQARLEN